MLLKLHRLLVLFPKSVFGCIDADSQNAAAKLRKNHQKAVLLLFCKWQSSAPRVRRVIALEVVGVRGAPGLVQQVAVVPGVLEVTEVGPGVFHAHPLPCLEVHPLSAASFSAEMETPVPSVIPNSIVNRSQLDEIGLFVHTTL